VLHYMPLISFFFLHCSETKIIFFWIRNKKKNENKKAISFESFLVYSEVENILLLPTTNFYSAISKYTSS